MSGNFSKGSEWRKWDLQVQPIKNCWFNCLDDNQEKIKKATKKYIDMAIQKKINVIGITDHNTGKAIDYALDYAENKNIYVLPGVELEANSGEHIIIIFNPEYKSKIGIPNWADVVETFLQNKCRIEPPFFDNGVPKKIKLTTQEFIKLINSEEVGILIFAHCWSKDGFFQRAGDSVNRREIIEDYKNNFFILEIKEHEQKNKIIEKLRGWGLDDRKYPIISCSDANQASDIGRYFTWIKADPTYEGLRQILYEPEERIFIGSEPELLKRKNNNKTKFIKSIRINQEPKYNGNKGLWFNNIEIPINPGMVAIIGNKGSGKSALLDIIALCGNTHLSKKDFSFLTDDRFLKDGLANNFSAELEWESENDIIKKTLNEGTDKLAPERVKYLPQNFVERLTNDLDGYKFEKTLEDIVFSHLPKDIKNKHKSFDELVGSKKTIIDHDAKNIKSLLKTINKDLIELEKKYYPEYKKKIENKLALKRRELDEHEKNRPNKVTNPFDLGQASAEQKKKHKEFNELDKFNKEKEQIEKKIKNKNEEKLSLIRDLEELNIMEKEANNIKTTIDEFLENNDDRYKKYGINISDVLKFNFNINIIKDIIKERKSKKQELLKDLEVLKKDVSNINEKINVIKDKLDEQQQKYQKYIEDTKEWEKQKELIIGDLDSPDSIKYLQKELDYVDTQLKNDLTAKRKERLKYSLEIYSKKRELVDIYQSFKKSIDQKLIDYQDILGEYEINIEVNLKLEKDFIDTFLSYIDQNKKGSFYGIEEGKKQLQKLIKTTNFMDEDSLQEFLEKIIEYLENDQREQFKVRKRYILNQIKENKLQKFYNYLFSLDYIKPMYELRLGNKSISQLSPGEKGALLIIFYLILDKDNIPLLIDEPEENLDNQSVYEILTNFLRIAKQKRQIILVTHNPNLAIVGDAEQIIFVNIDKKNQNLFSFNSGAIENKAINKHASDILEGTLRAFDKRRLKYIDN